MTAKDEYVGNINSVLLDMLPVLAVRARPWGSSSGEITILESKILIISFS